MRNAVIYRPPFISSRGKRGEWGGSVWAEGGRRAAGSPPSQHHQARVPTPRRSPPPPLQTPAKPKWEHLPLSSVAGNLTTCPISRSFHTWITENGSVICKDLRRLAVDWEAILRACKHWPGRKRKSSVPERRLGAASFPRLPPASDSWSASVCTLLPDTSLLYRDTSAPTSAEALPLIYSFQSRPLINECVSTST